MEHYSTGHYWAHDVTPRIIWPEPIGPPLPTARRHHPLPITHVPIG